MPFESTDDGREILRLIAELSPQERVIWMSLKGHVPRLLQRAFEESCRLESRAEEMSCFGPRVEKNKSPASRKDNPREFNSDRKIRRR